jgi:hypothetical protein
MTKAESLHTPSFDDLIVFQDRNVCIVFIDRLKVASFVTVQHIREIGEENPGWICTYFLITNDGNYLTFSKGE